MNKWLIGLILFCAFLIGLVAAHYINSPKKQASKPLVIATEETDIWQHTWSSNHAKKSLSEYNSELLVIDFWSSWCKPCIKSLPFYQLLFTQYPADKIQFVTINLDVDSEDARHFLNKHQLQDLNVLFDPKAISEQNFNIQGLPTLLIYDRNRNLIKTKQGFKQSKSEEFKRDIDTLIQSL